jgi:hypothetical protein
MPISTIGQNGLNAPLSLTTPALGTPSAINLSNATALARAALPTGSVLQVVYSNSHASQVSTTSTTFVTTGFSASITPTSATSKILALFVAPITNTSVGSAYIKATIARDGTVLDSTALAYYENSSGSGFQWVPSSMMYLDSPATTSSVTYSAYFKVNAGTGYFASNGSGCQITLMEIAG